MKILSKSVAQTHASAKKILQIIKKKPCIVFLRGDLGSGKTEWVRGFAKHYLGTGREVRSPSYSLINVYEKGKKKIVHADLFRLQSEDDLESTGLWDFLVDENILIIEWPRLSTPHVPKGVPVIEIHFEIKSDKERVVTVNVP